MASSFLRNRYTVDCGSTTQNSSIIRSRDVLDEKQLRGTVYLYNVGGSGVWYTDPDEG
jgi:hypothetical protein